MSFKMRRDISPLWLVVISMFSAASANAASGVWNGTVDGYWTNRQNWGASPYPSSGQTATFANGGNSRTVIDVAGLPSIKNVTFTSANVAAYTIGAGGSCAQTLVVDAESAITLDASAANSQVVNANIQLGSDQGATVNSFRNDSTTRTLTLAGDLLSPTTGGTPGYKNIYVNGAGETRLLGSWLRFDTGILTCFGCGKLALPGSNHVSRVSFSVAVQTGSISAQAISLSRTRDTWCLLPNKTASSTERGYSGSARTPRTICRGGR